MGSVYLQKGEHEKAVAHYVPSLLEYLAMGLVDGPEQCLRGLSHCYPVLGDRFVELCVKAGMPKDDAERLVEMFEQADKEREEEPEGTSSDNNE